MPYSIEKSGGRYVVTSPKGRKWKTTYSSRTAAEKGISYVQSRFTEGPPADIVGATSESAEERGEHTLASMKAAAEAW